jgi:small neutral amino acid transporter SnatA (MarC family)
VNVALLLTALVAATNPPRRRVSLSTDRVDAVVLGAGLVAALWIAFGALASPLLDALDVSRPNARIAAGLVLTVVAARDAVWRPPAAGAALPGWRAGFVPVFFPVLARPEVGLVALVLGADRGMGWSVLGGVLVFAAVVGWFALARGRATARDRLFLRVERGLGVVLSVLAVALGITMVVKGVLAI